MAPGLTSPVELPAAAHRHDAGRTILSGLLSTVQPGQAQMAADALLLEFGSLSRVLAAGKDAQARVLGGQKRIMDCLSLVREAMLHAMATDISSAPLLDNTEAVAGYLHVAIAHELREHVRVLFLDNRHHLIRDETVSSGSVVSAQIHPREIMRRALELGSTGLILAHNHPSGNPEPSRDDIVMTRAVIEAGRTLEVRVLDHLIIGRHGFVSMRSQGFI